MVDFSLNIVVVDDEPELAEMYRTYLTRLGHNAETATSGEEALEDIDGDTDIVFLDRRMPETTGDEVIQSLRDRGYSGYVAMVTAVEPDFDVLELGFNAYLTKPVKQEGFQKVIETYRTRREYSKQVQLYFDLISKKAALETHKSSDELENRDEYLELEIRIEELEAELGSTTSDLSDEDFDAIFYELS